MTSYILTEEQAKVYDGKDDAARHMLEKELPTGCDIYHPEGFMIRAWHHTPPANEENT
jgi:hypothetical protein